ncbi:hypothetical protein COS51_03405 [Candidatus Roizmanbacteria bacterium CG03_land_8_20_14_0_80_36_21]|nr:MAG: hypothetical protein COS51_03405 [Candidatus Roizmanbacteria bacterium CG03_land_8_20_14_0_80_36_21]
MNKFSKNVLLFLILSFLFVFVSGSIFANQTHYLAAKDDPSKQLDQLFQGANCGKINQKCCTGDFQIPSFNFSLPAPFDVLSTAANGIINFFTKKLIEPGMLKVRDFIFSNFEVNPNGYCQDGNIPSDKINPANCICLSEALENVSRLCLFIDGNEKNDCLSCVTNDKGIWTAIGCVKSDLGAFISEKILGWGVGLAGIIALLCIIFSAFQLQISQGNPEKIKKAQELLTSCIMGLMLIIFSVFILRLIGVDILKIPGFKRN